MQARHIAQKVGAPLVAGTPDPVSGADEVVAFAREHGLPIAIKAAFGGGGRGLKVARHEDEVAELYESAVREAVTAFGRGECFVERYLDKPRHVETQCLADQHGNVVVVSTRDCSLQRRHQKLVEEAPAPFLSDAQMQTLYDSSKAILQGGRLLGAGTCEFLVGQDGTISFLEVNTRLQVEHPVTEEVTGIDLVREMFRIAAGEELGYDDPAVVGHSIEFRINAEDAGRNFMPAPGTLTRWHAPSGPGVRFDGGYDQGETVPGSFDSLVGKLIVWGRDRNEALARSRRALDEFVVDGMPTVIPFHRRVVDDPAYIGNGTAFGIYTSWIETEFVNDIEPYAGASEAAEASERETVTVEVGGKRLSVSLPAGLAASGGGGASRREAGQAHGGQEGRRRRERRQPHCTHAGHDRQAGRRRGRHGRSRRPGRGPRGHEDGAADQRASRRHRHRAGCRGRRHGLDRCRHLRDQGLASARRRGLHGISANRAGKAADPPQLVLGFGNLSENAIRDGIAAVAPGAVADRLTGPRDGRRTGPDRSPPPPLA